MKRLPQMLLILTFIGFSWLAMQAVHEMGHVLVARVTGGEVVKVALHPLIVSRTDLGENPHPLAVVWVGRSSVQRSPCLRLVLLPCFAYRAFTCFVFLPAFAS